jgi:hypothetical protein
MLQFVGYMTALPPNPTASHPQDGGELETDCLKLTNYALP